MLFVSKKKYDKDVKWLNQVIDALKVSLDQSERYNEKLNARLREEIVESEQLRQQCDVLRRYGDGCP